MSTQPRDNRSRRQSRARPERISDKERAEIVRLAQEGYTRNAIARQVGRSQSAVSRVAADAGVTFDRTATRAATNARQEDAAAVRADLALDILGQAENALNRVYRTDEPHEHLAAAKAFSSLVNAYCRLDAMPETGREGRNLSSVDDWLAHITGGSPEQQVVNE